MNEELIKRLRGFKMQIYDWFPFQEAADALESADNRIKELEAQLVECQKDAERWRFKQTFLEDGGVVFWTSHGCQFRDKNSGLITTGKTEQEAIDAAIKESVK